MSVFFIPLTVISQNISKLEIEMDRLIFSLDGLDMELAFPVRLLKQSETLCEALENIMTQASLGK